MKRDLDPAELSDYLLESKSLFHHRLRHGSSARNNVLSLWFMMCDEDAFCMKWVSFVCLSFEGKFHGEYGNLTLVNLIDYGDFHDVS